MRLKQLYQKIEPHIINLDVSLVKRNDGSYVITNLKSLIYSIKEIESTGLFIESIRLLKETPIFEGYIDSVILNEHQYKIVSSRISVFKYSVTAFVEALQNANINMENEELQISVKLPDNLSFGELSKLFEKLKKGIEMPLAELPDSQVVQIKNFDSGSFWIDIVLPTASTLTFVAGLIWAGAVIHNKIMQGKAVKAYVEGLGHQAEWIDELKKLGKQQVDNLIEAEAKQLESEIFTSSDHERIKRLSMSIKEISELISSGVKLYPSLAVPESSRNLFPDFGSVSQIEGEIKRIGEGS